MTSVGQLKEHLVPASDLYWNFTGLIQKVGPPVPPDPEPQLQPLPNDDEADAHVPPPPPPPVEEVLYSSDEEDSAALASSSVSSGAEPFRISSA